MNKSFFPLGLIVAIVFCCSSLKAQVKKLSEGQSFNFLEGPVWDGDNTLYFSDINGNAIVKYDTDDSSFSFFSQSSNKSNGLMFDSNSNLVACEGELGRIAVYSLDGTLLKVLASEFLGKRFNKTNDLCIDALGGIYFTDPTWSPPSQDENRVYYLSPSGKLSAIINDLQKPNGILLSTDGKKLYVNDSWSAEVLVFDVEKDGTVSGRKVFGILEIPSDQGTNSGADGMAVDFSGNLYVTSNAGVQIFDKTGIRKEIVSLPEKSTNCTFGGGDMSTLYITAGKGLYSLATENKGFRHPFDLPSPEITVSIEEYERSKKGFRLSSNPISDQRIVITSENINLKNVKLTIRDSSGKKVRGYSYFSKGNKGEVILHEKLKPGAYVLRLNDHKNRTVLKMIVE